MKSERRGFIFARVGVRIAGHPRFLRIPSHKRAAALGVWLAALAFSREEQLDGFCPLEAIQTIAAKEVVDRLVDVGLLTRDEKDGIQGIWVLRYDEFNDTKAEIDAARDKERRRKSDARSGGRPRVVPGTVPPVVPPDNSMESAGSPSSFYFSALRSPDREPEGSVYGEPPSDIVVTDEIRASCAMAGARAPGPADVVACLANARKKGLKRADWSAELVSWMVRGKQHFDRPEPAKPPSRKLLQLPPKVTHG